MWSHELVGSIMCGATKYYTYDLHAAGPEGSTAHSQIKTNPCGRPFESRSHPSASVVIKASAMEISQISLITADFALSRS